MEIIDVPSDTLPAAFLRHFNIYSPVASDFLENQDNQLNVTQPEIVMTQRECETALSDPIQQNEQGGAQRTEEINPLKCCGRENRPGLWLA